MTTTGSAGYWIPRALRDEVLAAAGYEATSTLRAQLVPPGTPGAVTAHWPRLSPAGWDALWAGLRAAPPLPGSGIEAWEAALRQVARRLSDPRDALSLALHSLIPPCTGFAPAMLDFVLGFFSEIPLGELARAARQPPPALARRRFVPLPGLPGGVRFTDTTAAGKLLARWPAGAEQALARPAPHPRTLIGYAAGNIPGTALLIVILGQLITPRPAILVRNSRHEPFFTPLLLSALEAIDPDLVANVALLIWDYDDAALQADILRQADRATGGDEQGLVLVVSGDDTMAQVDADIRRCGATPRVHRHGHKVSFLAVGRSALSADRLPMVAPLAALDTVMWDQNGCLSPRIHFVERGGPGSPDDYAAALCEAMREIGALLPGGLVDLRRLHVRFDKFRAIEEGGRATLHSRYDDPFLVVVDRREYDARTLADAVNDARDRTVIVRPVDNLLDVPRDYLRHIPAHNLQTLSVALDSRAPRFLPFAEAVSRCGVTALRTVGRAAFPGLAHSWDGLLPSDLTTVHPPGYYTTYEFSDALAQIQETVERLGARQRSTQQLQSTREKKT